ncbi:MAG: cell division protein FtsA [Firmicutes bacterium]|nr:cell division protein FtsA [Bacillota bacterium]
MYDAQNTIFALDIGTRTVAGLVVTDESKPRVLAAAIREHDSRAMEDGQIHDVEAVAKVVKSIADELSERVGFALESVAIAAAGRSLLTQTAEVVKDIRAWGSLSAEDVTALELEAIRQAQQVIRQSQAQDSVNTRYHCVGYSVNEYLLDHSPIKKLIGHRGNDVVVRVTATFLPEIVVDALCTVIRKAGLQVRSITLEPIAASQVVIPPDLRLLNLALVDLGAGTSDIAIAKDGMITGYGMVPLAGDEVSEALEEHFLLDFATAEKVKRQLATASEVQFRDILGTEYHLPTAEVVEVIKPTIEKICRQIAEEILRLNGGQSPKAVICIGGASQTPRLCEMLADILQLPPNRVAIRYGREAAALFADTPEALTGPDGITPLGIALSAQSRSVLSFQAVDLKVQDLPVRLFNLIAPTVADALIAADIDPSIVRNRLGLALTVKVNGMFRIVRGTPGRPGQFLLNGEPATLDTPVHDGDQLTVIPAEDGKAAEAVVADLISVPEIRNCYFNGELVSLRPTILLNGRRASLDTPVPDGADIIYDQYLTVRDVLRQQGISPDGKQSVQVSVNGRTRTIRMANFRITVNGREADLDHRLADGDWVVYQEDGVQPTIRSFLLDRELEEVAAVSSITVTVNGEPLTLPGGPGKLLRNGKPAQPDDPVNDGDDIQVIPGRGVSHYFAEVFNYIPIEIGERPEKAVLITLRNGQPAEYSDELADGDELVIRWECANSVSIDSEFVTPNNVKVD